MIRKAIGVATLCLALCLGGGAGASAREIVVLAQFPLSGAHGSLNEIGWGFTDVMNWFNEEKGGVGGQKVKWFMEDMRYSPAVEVANFHKYCSEYGPDELLMAKGYITGALKPHDPEGPPGGAQGGRSYPGGDQPCHG